MKISELFSRLAAFFYVPKCVACQERLDPDGGALCPTCLAAYMQEKATACPYCGSPFSSCLCATETLKRAGIDRVVKLFQYHPHDGRAVQNRLLFAIKRRGLAPAIELLAEELSANLELGLPRERDGLILTYAPRSPKARARYGFDHMEILGREVARRLGVTFDGLLIRKDGKEQKGLESRTARFCNMRGAFEAPADPRLRTADILLLDDVTTSGATLVSAVRALRAAGAKRITVAVLGCTLMKKNG